MKIRTTLIAAASALALTAVLVAPAGAATTVNVANNVLTCNSNVGTIKFNPELTLYSGTVDTTPPGTVAVKSVQAGCTSDAGGGVLVESGSTAGTLTSAHSSCNGLTGLSTGTSGNLIVKYKTFPTSPKITPAASTLAVTQTYGAQFNNPAAGNPTGDTDAWGAAYGIFQIGHDAAHGNTTQPSVTGAFTGGNSGHTSTVDATTGQDASGLALSCLLLGGLKEVNFGIGGSTLQ